jgi:hypothetical protein
MGHLSLGVIAYAHREKAAPHWVSHTLISIGGLRHVDIRKIHTLYLVF